MLLSVIITICVGVVAIFVVVVAAGVVLVLRPDIAVMVDWALKINYLSVLVLLMPSPPLRWFD